MTESGGPIAALAATRVVACLPATGEPDRYLVVAEVLVQEGMQVLTVAAGRTDLISRLAEALGGRAMIGVHQVTTEAQVVAAAAAGAAFGLAPVSSATLTEAAREQGLPLFAGGFSPTELVAAWAYRPTGLYVYPADVLGVSYAPYAAAAVPEAPLLVGGGSPYAVGQWLAAGALAVVSDDSLVLDSLVDGDLGYLRERARGYLREARSAPPWQPTVS